MSPYVGRHQPDHGHRSALVRYGVSVACVAIGLFLALWLDPVLDPEALLFVAVLVAARFGGLGPGLLAALLGALSVDYYFTTPLHTFSVEIGHVRRLGVFSLLAAFFATISAAQRRAERALRIAHDEMEGRVQERTAELRQTNEQLQAEIAERRRAEEVLRQQANLLEQTHDAIVVWEFPRTIVYWNRGAEELYGFSRDEALGRRGHELLCTEHPMPTPFFEAILQRDGEWTGELAHTTRDGRRIIVESRQVLVREADGRRVVLETNRDITERKRAERALEDLAGRLIHAQEEERSRIGRELHDHISQTLGVLSIKIDQLRVREEFTPSTGAALDELRRDTSTITDDVHRLSHRLHSSTLDYLGLLPALQKLVAEFSERHKISITLAHASLPVSVPSAVALCLFRVAEESLTNIAKHSKARSANIQVTGAPDGITLTVADGGSGFDMTTPGSKAGLGLVSMQERLRVLHGTIRVDSAPSRGTTINAWVPAMALTSAGDDAAHRSETGRTGPVTAGIPNADAHHETPSDPAGRRP
jgi:PAS domain S-box-containing protein